MWQALRALEQRNERDREYTIFVDSTSAITMVRDDARGPGQRFGVTAIEVETRLAAADNKVTIRWVPPTLGLRRTRWPISRKGRRHRQSP